MKEYYEDSIYHSGAKGEVFQGKPSSELGNEGDERWCWVDGDGLFLAKKYQGEWRFFTSSTELLEAGVVSSDSSSSGGGSSTSAQTGTFTNLTVTNSSSLQTSTGISGTLSVTATSLTAFPIQDNLKIQQNKLDTVQHIKTTSSPQFNEIGLGTAASGEAGNIELTSVLGVSAPTFINAALFLSETNYTNTSGTNLTDGLGLRDLTQSEATQLKNIDSATISSTQWGYVGNMDQNVATINDVIFAKASLTESGKTWSIDPIGNAGSDAGLTTGALQITTTNTNDAPVIIGGNQKDDHTVRNYGYQSGLFTGNGWSIYEDNNKHNMEVDNLSVRGTLSVYELLIQQIRATNGAIFVTSAAKLETDGNAVKHNTGGNYTFTFQSDEDDNKPHPFADGDLLLARRVDISGDTLNVVSETRINVISASAGNSNQLNATVTESSDTLPTGNGDETNVLNGYDFVRIGSSTDPNRRGGIYLTSDDTLAPFIDIFDEVSSWQEWDGITNIFGLSDGSFDLATAGTYTADDTKITGSEWKARSLASSNVQIITNGGISNQKYCKIDRNDSGTAYIYQPITLPYVSSGSYKVTIEWYGKQDPVSVYEPRVGLRDVFPSTANNCFNEGGALESGGDLFDWEDITQPEQQRTADTVWHRYQWRITVPSTLFSGSNDKTMFLVFATANAGTGVTTWVDDVKVHMEGKVKTRIGRLEGVGKTGYGLWGENVYLKGRIEASEGYIGNEFAGWRINSTGITNEGTQSYISAGQTNVGLDGGGSYLDGAGDLSLGNSASAGLKWDQSANTLTVRGNIHVASGGSIDSSLLPLGGKNLKLVAGGLNSSGASCGVFEVASDGQIDSQISGAPNTSFGVTFMKWDAGDNKLDTTLNSSGVYHQTSWTSNLAQAWGATANDTICAILVHGNAQPYIKTGGGSYSSSLVAAIKQLGGTVAVMDTSIYWGSYLVIGRKQTNPHSDGTEFVGSLGENGGIISLTINLEDDVITILDHEGPLMDFDATSPRSWSHSREDGFKFKNIDYNSSYYRTFQTFNVPFVQPQDTSTVYLTFVSKNLGDGGVAPVKLYLNGNHLTGLSTADLLDPNDSSQYQHTFHAIPAEYFKTDIGEVNTFQFMLDANNGSDTMTIYDFALNSSVSGTVYNGGDLASPEGNQLTNPGFEIGDHGDNTALGWYLQTTGNDFYIDNVTKMTGNHSLKHTNDGTGRRFDQDVKLSGGKTYILRFNYRFNNSWGSNTGPTIRLYSTNINTNTTDTHATLDFNDDGSYAWTYGAGSISGGYKYFPYTALQTGNISDTMLNQWQTFEAKFSTASSNTYGTHGTDIVYELGFFDGTTSGITHYWDHIEFFEVSDASPEETGLFMTGNRMGFYNGTGGLNGWSSVIKSDGTFFFGSPTTAANLVTPSSGGPFVRFTGSDLEVNANLIAGLIQSENLTSSTGTQINLTDGSMTTKGTSTSTGLVLDSNGNLELNGATLDGGTITGQLMQSNYAEGAVTFVTKKDSGITAVNNYTVNVNGVERLICERVVESADATFGEADNNTSGTTKVLGMYGYDYQGVNTHNRAADTNANTNVTFTSGTPFYLGASATNDGNGDNDELVHFRFRIGGVQDDFYIYHKTRIRPTSPNRGYVKVKAKVGSGSYTDIISADSSNDFYKAGTQSWTLPSGLVVSGFATSDYQDAGDIIDMKCSFYLSGTTDGMYSASTGLDIYFEQLGNGSHVQTSTAFFGPAVWKIYN